MSDKTFIFDFPNLVKIFTEICPDFIAEPSYKNATVSRRFAEQVIFEFSKQVKAAKAQKKNRTWRFSLEQGRSKKYSLIISLYGRTPPQQPSIRDGNLELTFKEASLLAVAKYCQIVPHLVQRGEIVLTPLAGAAFATDDMPKLANALGEPLSELVMAVISSCQTKGYHLEHSRCYIAVAALNRTVGTQQLRDKILKDCIEMYQLHGKDFDAVKYEICSKFLKPQKSTVNKADIDKIVSQIKPFNMTQVNNQVQRREPVHKPKMKCAAVFTGPIIKK